MEYHYFTIEDVEMLKFNGITHLHNHLNYLIHTDKDQKFTNEDSVRNVSFIFDNKGNPKALKWTDDLGKRIELKKYVFRYIRDLYKRLFYARVECPRRDVHNWNKEMVAEMCREQGLADYYPVQDVKDAFKTMEYIDEKEAIEIVLNDSEETLIYHKSPEEECFTKEALKHETINFDKESKMEEDLDELEK